MVGLVRRMEMMVRGCSNEDEAMDTTEDEVVDTTEGEVADGGSSKRQRKH